MAQYVYLAITIIKNHLLLYWTFELFTEHLHYLLNILCGISSAWNGFSFPFHSVNFYLVFSLNVITVNNTHTQNLLKYSCLLFIFTLKSIPHSIIIDLDFNITCFRTSSGEGNNLNWSVFLFLTLILLFSVHIQQGDWHEVLVKCLPMNCIGWTCCFPWNFHETWFQFYVSKRS